MAGGGGPDDGFGFGFGTAGSGGRERGPGGRGAGGSAGRPGRAVRRDAHLDGAGGGRPGSRGPGTGDQRVGPGLQRQLLEATFTIDSAREVRVAQVTSAAGVRHGTVEPGHDRGVVSIFGPVRATRLAYRNRREANLYPADARWALPGDPYSAGMRALTAYHLAGGGYGQAQEIIEARTGVRIGHAQPAGLAEDLAAWTEDFYEQRARDAEEDLPDTDVIMMQADGKGIAMRPEHRKAAADSGSAHPGVKKMAEIVAVADLTPAIREPEDIAAPPARRKAHPGPAARGKWVSASITGTIEDMTAAAFDEADRRDPGRDRQRIFLVDGNKQQITAIEAQAAGRDLKVPVLIDYTHVSGYIGSAAAALHPGSPQAAGQWADGQLPRVLHGRARAVAATLASVAAKARSGTRHLDLTDVDKAVTYLTNNHQHMRYDKALEHGWPIATGVIEGACRFVIEDRFGITGARWSPDGAEVILKLRAVVVNGDLHDYMNYYKKRYRHEHHLARYDPGGIEHLGLTA
ncbi:MAG: ISKra4 family transposase [Trebonia sp.]